jgi:hypothetical protein
VNFAQKVKKAVSSNGPSTSKKKQKLAELKRTMYVQCNQMKKDYHGMINENMRNKTKARQMDKEILKLKDLVQKTKVGFWEHQQKFQEEAHVNNEKNSQIDSQGQGDANGN